MRRRTQRYKRTYKLFPYTTLLRSAVVHERLESRLRPALLTRRDRHRAAGHRIALLTGTPDFIAAPLADRIEADIWRATRCGQRGGKFCADQIGRAHV